MATLSILNVPILQKKTIKTDSTHSNEEYSTSRSKIQAKKTSTDSDSILIYDSSTEDTDYDDFICTSKAKFTQSDIPSSKPEVHLKLENDQAEFYAHIPSADSTIRKRDRIHSAFHKKFSRSNNNLSDTTSNEILVKTLVSMQNDIQEIINGIEQIDQSSSKTILTKHHLSFHERQREKLQMMRIAQMLHPPNLLTYNLKEPIYAYTDIIEPTNFNLLRLKKGIPDENLLIQCKPIQHRKCRYRTQRGLLRIKHDLNKIRRYICEKNPTKCQENASSLDVLNYQLRLQKTLLEFRKQIAEYDRIHASMNDHQPSISQIIANTSTVDPNTKVQIEDHRMKEYVHKNSKNELISAPYIPRRTPTRQIPSKKDCPIDTRFDSTTFLDLNKEAEKFFGRHIPFKIKEKLLKNPCQSTDEDEYFDCTSSISNRPQSPSLTTVEF